MEAVYHLATKSNQLHW